MKAGKVVFVILVILLLGAGGGAFYIWNGMQPVKASDQAVKFTIQSGMGTSKIADVLENSGLIKNATIFKGYLKWKHEGSHFQAGVYEAKPGITYDELIAKMNSGDVVKEAMIRITIPEGYTVEQIAKKVSEVTGTPADDFIKLADHPGNEAVEAFKGVSDIPNLKHASEGYLFPDTYEFKKGTNVSDIYHRMMEQMQSKIDSIPDFQQKLKDRGVTQHELLTIASLIEREVVVDKERPIVAGVIYNRLDKNMKLEIDATVQYALPEPKERLLYKDLKVESPYNTYLHEGLPPGPICSPSLASIEAALNPEPSEYLYYVTKKDGSHEHLFAKTYQEHLENIKKSKSTTK
ncbi:endolytic transglycosylase MltG [Paenibacillus sp. KQZ6P-2]|uniref:Endolytic murein transglycosylase n=1 Tax=Paenibacillus mangrovi TaxID=2931978 RepID=A0A9X1WQ68_9BACL|nr:endolytic transglycosylase MltG [Paenibacillus mangrovi]MCJ8011668.1 endolytic transglycosylase MltG [Paenibacillus mangrovi]